MARRPHVGVFSGHFPLSPHPKPCVLCPVQPAASTKMDQALLTFFPPAPVVDQTPCSPHRAGGLLTASRTQPQSAAASRTDGLTLAPHRPGPQGHSEQWLPSGVCTLAVPWMGTCGVCGKSPLASPCSERPQGHPRRAGLPVAGLLA